MGKVTVYQCDSCGSNYKKPSDVITVDGDIYDGDGNIIHNGDKDEITCRKCFQALFELELKEAESNHKSKQDVDIIEEDPTLKDLNDCILLKKICDEKDESDFIHFIGHVSRDSFEKIYSDSLIKSYYPIDFDSYEDLKIESFDKEKSISVINKVFASVPQIKQLRALLYDQENLAVINKKIFEE
jgi:hypothetical protein